MRLGYRDVRRYPAGWQGWLAAHPEALPPEARPRLPRVGDMFPAELPDPFLDIDRRMLEPQTGFLLLELHSSLCGCCRDELPVYETLHARITADRELAGLLRMAGISAYDSRRDLAKARRTGQVSYPLLPDERGEAFAALGRPELPVIMLLRRKEGRGREYEVLLINQGRLSRPDAFFEEVRRIVLSR